MSIAVTGASGFLGSEIVRQATLLGLRIRALDRQAKPAALTCEYMQADILGAPKWSGFLAPCNVVIHAAGLAHIFDKAAAREAPFMAVNETGTVNVAQAAAQAGAQHFILISSVSVYGGSRADGHEDSGCYPEGPYAQSKHQAELRAIEIAQASGMALTILRLATLYGEGDPGNVARLMRSIDRGRFVWVGSGSNRKSLLHREDAARACLVMAQRPASGINTYNVSAPACTMREVVDGLASALNRKVWPLHVPDSWAVGAAAVGARFQPGRFGTVLNTLQKWLADDVYSGRRFEEAHGFQASVDLNEGLKREVAWYRNLPTQTLTS